MATEGLGKTFGVSGIFVSVGGLPTPLRQLAELNPLTALATAVRQLSHNPTGVVPDVWTLRHPVITSLLWAFGLRAVFIPLSVAHQRMGR